jgi:hypothetical protein
MDGVGLAVSLASPIRDGSPGRVSSTSTSLALKAGTSRNDNDHAGAEQWYASVPNPWITQSAFSLFAMFATLAAEHPRSAPDALCIGMGALRGLDLVISQAEYVRAAAEKPNQTFL